MADVFSAIKLFVEGGLKIWSTLKKTDRNEEDCRTIGYRLRSVRSIAKNLQGSPKIMEDDSMRDTVEGLKKALRRASEFVAKCEGEGFLRRALNADDIADKLRRICDDVQHHMSALQLANGALNHAMLAQLDAKFDKILQMHVAHPDVHQRKEVSGYKNKRETEKTDVARPEEVKVQKNKKRGGSKVVPHASLPDGIAEPASAVSAVGQNDGCSTIINKASSSIPKLVDEAQSVGVSAAPFHPQKITSISEEPGETCRYKIHSHSSKTSKLLEVYPLQLRFPFEPNKETIQCPVTLTNKTDHNVGIWIKPINGRFTKTEIMEPHSTLVVYATMKMHAQPPKDTVKFEVLMIIVQSKGDHRKLESSIGGELNMDSGFMAHVEKLRKAEVYWAMLTAITCDPESCQIISRSIEKMTLTSIDVHPTKTWIVTGYEEGKFSIWDYQKQEIVMELQVNEEPGEFERGIHDLSQYFKESAAPHSVLSAKFIARQECLVVGDGRGYIYVYDYTVTKPYKKFRAHEKSVNSLAAHPTQPYLLSSSASSRNIKLWDWSKNWKEIKKFDVKPKPTYYNGVHSVKFNPRDTDTFACVNFDKRVKVWNIKTSNLQTTLEGPSFKAADYFFTDSDQDLMVTLRLNSHNFEIWDLKTRKVVHTLGVSGHKTTRVAFHPKLRILVTTLDDGTVCLWDARTYRLEKMVHITDSECRGLVFVPDTNGLPRLAVAFKTMIAIMEINLPIANTSNASGPVAGASYE